MDIDKIFFQFFFRDGSEGFFLLFFRVQLSLPVLLRQAPEPLKRPDKRRPYSAFGFYQGGR